MSSVSDIKLIRTDTTLDLSQKAEKRCRLTRFPHQRFALGPQFHVGKKLLSPSALGCMGNKGSPTPGRLSVKHPE